MKQYSLSDSGMRDALYEIESMRRIACLELVEDAIPYETTILNLRRLLERHQLIAKLMDAINDDLEHDGLLLKGGTMVDLTIIHAAPSLLPRTERSRATRQCIKPRKAINGTSA